MALITAERLKQLEDATEQAWKNVKKAQQREVRAVKRNPAIKKLDAQMERLYKKRRKEVEKLPTYEKLNRLEVRAQQIDAAAALASAILRCESISSKK